MEWFKVRWIAAISGFLTAAVILLCHFGSRPQISPTTAGRDNAQADAAVPASFGGEPSLPGTPGRFAIKSSSGIPNADVFGAFDDWSARYLSGSPEERKALAIEG